VAVDLHIFGVDMEDARSELAHRSRVVDELPDKMRRVEVQAEVLIRNELEHLPPDGRRVCQVAAARPLVRGEDHRAVLDRDLLFVLGVELDARWPILLEVYVVVDMRSALVAAAACAL